MNNVIFTGGNWKARRATGEGVILASVGTNNTGINTRLFEIVTDEHVANANQETNAVLMAAAPELLAALRAVLACPAMCEDTAEPETVKAYDLAMDAIAKAEGKAE